jgi:hypothetical protein
MPSRINEVDDDLNMTGRSFRLPQPHHVFGGSPWYVSCSADTTAGDSGQHLPSIET